MKYKCNAIVFCFIVLLAIGCTPNSQNIAFQKSRENSGDIIWSSNKTSKNKLKLTHKTVLHESTTYYFKEYGLKNNLVAEHEVSVDRKGKIIAYNKTNKELERLQKDVELIRSKQKNSN